ncbi:MAG: S9 family peptidase, partial [Anaerolineales bacterium]
LDISQVRWSPEGGRLACAAATPDGITSIFVYGLADGSLTQVTPGTHEAAEAAWAPDGERLAYTWNVAGSTDLGVLHLPTGEVRHWRAAPGVHSQPRFSADGRTLLSLFNGPRHPESLWAMAVGGGLPLRPRARPLTGGLPRGYTGQEFVQPERVSWVNEGLTITGLLYKPRGLRRDGRTPAVVWVHGGPTWEFKNEWWVAVQHLVSEGCVVLAPNYRGSTGRGRAFQEANRYDLGGADMRDVIAGASFLARERYADPERIAITGGSYGGYLTMTALTRHPEVFAAGSAFVPFLNWFTEHANEREDLRYWDLQNFGDPVKDADRYRAYSPIYYMENIRAPIQMVAGANDPRCPADETEQARSALKEMDVPHDIIIYPDEGHGFQQVRNRVDAYRRRAAFLREHLGLKGAAGR